MSNSKESNLLDAVKQSNNESGVLALIGAGADVNMTDKDGKTALLYAVQQSNNENVVLALIGAGADVNMTDKDGRTALLYAVQKSDNENVHVVRALIESLVIRDKLGSTAHFYVSLKNPSPLSWLLEGGNRNLKLEDNCNVDIVSFLIQKWLLSSLREISFDYFKNEILDVFAKYGFKHERFVKAIVDVLFLESSNYKRRNEKYPFLDEEKFKFKTLGELYCKYIIRDHDSLEKEAKMKSILKSFESGFPNLSDVLKLLVELGADPNSADSIGNTVLHHTTRLPLLGAPQEKVMDLCNHLKRLGANFNKRNHERQTALLFCLSTDVDKQTFILECQYHVPFPSAVKSLVQVCMFLVKQGSCMDETSRSGESIFHLIIKFFERCLKVTDEAIRKDVLQEANKLLQLFPPWKVTKENIINKPDVHLNSPLHLWASLSLPSHQDYIRSASREDHTFKSLLEEILKFLLECGAKVNARNENDETPLHLCKTLIAVELLLEAGANPNDRDSSGRSPLLVAAVENNVHSNPDYFFPDVTEDPEIFWRSVLEKGLDPWTVAKQGESVLSVLLKSEAFILARALIEVACKENFATNDVKLSFLNVICNDEARHTHWKTKLVEVILNSASKSNLSLDSPLRLCCRNIVRFGMFDGKPYQPFLQKTKHEPSNHNDEQPPSKKRKKDESLKKEEGKEESNEEQVDYDSVHCKIAKQLLWYGGVDISIRDSSGKSCLEIAEACPSLKDLLTKPIEIDKIPMFIPWTSTSDKYKPRLAKVARRQECELVDQIWYHRDHIGSGSFGSIYAGINEKDGREVAIKKTEKVRMQRPEDKREITHLIALADCEQVVRYISFFEDEHFSYVSLELMEGNLKEYLNGSTTDATQATILCKDVVMGLKFLHEQNVLHRDLKPQNILYKVHPKLCLKIADFGLSRIIDSVTSTTVYRTHAGTRCWIAPEVFKSKMNTVDKNCFAPASDMFSCGLILHYILSGPKHPFNPIDLENKSEMEIAHETEDNIMKGKLEGWDNSLCPEATHLVKRMLESNEGNRPSAEEALEHPLFWSNEKKLDFLKAVGNQKEFECPRSKRTPSLTPVETDLENSFSTIVRHASWTGSRHKHMPAIYRGMTTGKARKSYDTTTAVELVRFIRNVYEHYREKTFVLSTPVTTVTPVTIEQMLFNEFVFLEYFPDLVMEVYKAVTTHGWDQTRDDIKSTMNKK